MWYFFVSNLCGTINVSKMRYKLLAAASTLKTIFDCSDVSLLMQKSEKFTPSQIEKCFTQKE